MKKFLCLLILPLGLLASLPAVAALAIQSWTQPDGARVLFVPNHAIPMLDVSVQFDAGQRRDPAGKAGLAELTVASLTRGVTDASGTLTEAQILDGFADVARAAGLARSTSSTVGRGVCRSRKPCSSIQLSS